MGSLSPADQREAEQLLQAHRYYRQRTASKLLKIAARPRPQLVITESTKTCDLCGKPVLAGSEGARGVERSVSAGGR
jgi:hypothetical protein